VREHALPDKPRKTAAQDAERNERGRAIHCARNSLPIAEAWNAIKRKAEPRGIMADTLHLTVTGMTCGGCENAVKRSLGQLRGVERVAASHVSQQVDVTFDGAQVSPAAVKAAIEALGYRVHP
jgi:copper chaperone